MAPFSPCPPCHPPPPTATHYPHLVQPLPSPLPAMSDLHDLSAHALMAAYRQRQLSPVEVTQAVLSHIARWEPHLQATYLLRPEAALAQARASEARWLRGAPLSALDGVPGTIKENIATEGDPTPLGTAALAPAPAAAARAPPPPPPPRPPPPPPPPPTPPPPPPPPPPAPPPPCPRRPAAPPARPAGPGPGPSSLPRPRCPTTACCPRACRACTRSRATRGIWPKAPAAPAPAAGRLRPQAMARCTSAPTSAARCACPPVGAASSASSPAWAASLSTRPTPAAPPAR